jgi:hypothetical protein
LEQVADFKSESAADIISESVADLRRNQQVANFLLKIAVCAR